jgi:hypothetical protein
MSEMSQDRGPASSRSSICNTSSLLPESMIKILQYSFRFQNKDLFPIYHHKKYKLFRREKVWEYANENVVNVSTVKTDVISGSTQDEFTKDYGRKMGISSHAVAPVARAEFKVAASYAKTKRRAKSKVFSQSRLQVTKLFLRLVQNPFSTYEDLNALLEPEAFEALENIRSREAAERFLRKYGRFYITQAHIGGLRIYESQDTTSSGEDSSAMTLDSQVAAGDQIGVVKNSAAPFSKKSKMFSKESTQNSTIVGTTVGGDPSFFQSSAKEWIQSISEGNYEISHCMFKPLYTLLERGPSTNIGNIRRLLKDAHYSYLEVIGHMGEDKYIQDRTCYFIQNESYQKYYISADNAKPKRISENLCNEEHHELHKKHRILMLHNFFDAGPEKPVSLENMEHVYISLQSVKNGSFFGQRKRNPRATKISLKSDRLSAKNQWYLQEVLNKHGTFFLLSANRKYMLGMKRSRMLRGEEVEELAEESEKKELGQIVESADQNLQSNQLVEEGQRGEDNHDYLVEPPGSNVSSRNVSAQSKSSGGPYYKHKYIMQKYSKGSKKNNVNFMWNFRRYKDQTVPVPTISCPKGPADRITSEES